MPGRPSKSLNRMAISQTRPLNRRMSVLFYPLQPTKSFSHHFPAPAQLQPINLQHSPAPHMTPGRGAGQLAAPTADRGAGVALGKRPNFGAHRPLLRRRLKRRLRRALAKAKAPGELFFGLGQKRKTQATLGGWVHPKFRHMTDLQELGEPSHGNRLSPLWQPLPKKKCCPMGREGRLVPQKPAADMSHGNGSKVTRNPCAGCTKNPQKRVHPYQAEVNWCFDHDKYKTK